MREHTRTDRNKKGVSDPLPRQVRRRSLNEELDVKDVTWLTPVGDEMTAEKWQDGPTRCFGMLLDGRAQESGIKRRGSDATLLLIYNAHFDVVNFTLPDVADGSWRGRYEPTRSEARVISFRAQICRHWTVARRVRSVCGRHHNTPAPSGNGVNPRGDGDTAPALECERFVTSLGILPRASARARGLAFGPSPFRHLGT